MKKFKKFCWVESPGIWFEKDGMKCSSITFNTIAKARKALEKLPKGSVLTYFYKKNKDGYFCKKWIKV